MDLIERRRACLNRHSEALKVEIGDIITRDLFKARKSLDNGFVKEFKLGDIFCCGKPEGF